MHAYIAPHLAQACDTIKPHSNAHAIPKAQQWHKIKMGIPLIAAPSTVEATALETLGVTTFGSTFAPKHNKIILLQEKLTFV